MTGSVEVMATTAPAMRRAAGLQASKSAEQRQRDLIRNTAALSEAALEDMTDETIDQMEDLLQQVQADFNYYRRLSGKEVSTGT
jgi:hypothetical protein